ncbi:hypothetical protein P154DRAFT_259040 [Amniculicola lignicola CBS 123094]|uniref:Uncharacterized protein n=1 Tax=Amniculicola lignicola CBS 123094 TaxID=1392246 RepID=A0A6A5X137_9PLEO|nr:hypothetical protein P154DRAFT_259040 [Amniculicola lignicola CBS 123094]
MGQEAWFLKVEIVFRRLSESDDKGSNNYKLGVWANEKGLFGDAPLLVSTMVPT